MQAGHPGIQMRGLDHSEAVGSQEVHDRAIAVLRGEVERRPMAMGQEYDRPAILNGH